MCFCTEHFVLIIKLTYSFRTLLPAVYEEYCNKCNEVMKCVKYIYLTTGWTSVDAEFS
jgi:hypothetical protein